MRLFHYDHINRQKDEQWLDDAVPANVVYTDTLTYNPDGTLATNSDVAGPAGTGTPISSYTYGYDKLGRLETVDNDGTPGPWSNWNVVLTSLYDENGNRESLTSTVTNGLGVVVPDVANAYLYDKINRQTRVEQAGQIGGNLVNPQRADFGYYADGRMETITRYSDLAGTQLVATSSYTYDDAGRLTGLTHDLPGTANDIAYAWAFDRANRLTGYTRDDGGVQSESQTYGYDDAGQLTSSTGDLPAENYTYDDNGNRTSGGFSTPTGTGNRLATDGTYDYGYDDEGNLILRTEVATPGNARVFAWDYRNRLTAVRDYTGYVDEQNPGTLVAEVTYAYNVNNLRIKKTVDADGAGTATAVPTWFVYDGSHVAMQFNWWRSTSQKYLYGPAVDQVLANFREDGSIRWALGDHLGSVRDIINNNGSPIDKITYSAFGEVTAETYPDKGFLFGYTGEVLDDETGLGYHRARYLDHATGRWLSEDPIGFAGDLSNLYRYVGNGVTYATDPFGLKTVTQTAVSKSYINTITNVGSMPNWAAIAKLWAFAQFTNQFENDGQVATPAADGRYRLRAQLNISFDVNDDRISNLNVTHTEQAGYEGAGLYGTVNVVEDEERISDSIVKVRWLTWGRPNAAVEWSFQNVWPRTSKNIWHQVTLTIFGCGDSADFTVEEFVGSDFPSHRLWVGASLEGDLPQGALSSLWRSDTIKGPAWVTRDGTGPFVDPPLMA